MSVKLDLKIDIKTFMVIGSLPLTSQTVLIDCFFQDSCASFSCVDMILFLYVAATQNLTLNL